MGTVRVEYCPDCGGMVGEGWLYWHQQKFCPKMRGCASAPTERGEMKAEASLAALPSPPVEGQGWQPWMKDEQHSGRKVVVESLKGRIREWKTIASKTRNAYEGDYMRVPLSFYASVADEVVALLQARLDLVLAPPASGVDRIEPREPDQEER